MTSSFSGRRAALAALALLWLAATLRAFAVWSHDPLYAYANSYDQTRYTNCFGFYPDRPGDIPPQQNSPQAPFSTYRFIATADPMCYWSSELAFTGATALIWHVGEAAGFGDRHDVRWVGALRWSALMALSISLSLVWLRRGDARSALINAALLPLLFADPGNTFYLNTFYAEWTSLLAAYGLVATSLLWRDAGATRWRFAALAALALVLATSKIQHLLLPLALAIVFAVVDRLRRGHLGWRAAAIGCGALAGFLFQAVQLQRGGEMMAAIDQYNRADVVFTALLPFADDRPALLTELGIDPSCVIYADHHAWEFPDLPETVCAGLSGFTRGKELATLARHPRIAARLLGHGILALDPWIAKNLGQVEGGDFAVAPSTQPSVGRVLHAWPMLQLGVLALPLIGLARPRSDARRLDLAAALVVIMLATFAITVLGDGLADTAKQGHLVVNSALAFLVITLASAVRGRASRFATAATIRAKPN